MEAIAVIVTILSLLAIGFLLGVVSVFKYPYLLVRLHLLEDK